jgi:hypothetical protein
MYPPPRGIIPLASASIEASEGFKAVEVFDSYGSSLSFFGSSLRVSCLLRCAESHYSPHLRASLLTSVVSVFFSLGSQRPGEYLLRCVLPIVLRASGLADFAALLLRGHKRKCLLRCAQKSLIVELL